MVIRISKKTKQKDVSKALEKLGSKRKKIDLDKFFGKVNFGVDGLTYQKKIRNEWS